MQTSTLPVRTCIPEDHSCQDTSPEADLRDELISEAATLLTQRSPRTHPRLTATIAAIGAGDPLHPMTRTPSPDPPAGDEHMADDPLPSGMEYPDLEEEEEENGSEAMDDGEGL
eukprot:jgi/Tetstr1/459884/TSEL_005226.t1